MHLHPDRHCPTESLCDLRCELFPETPHRPREGSACRPCGWRGGSSGTSAGSSSLPPGRPAGDEVDERVEGLLLLRLAPG